MTSHFADDTAVDNGPDVPRNRMIVALLSLIGVIISVYMLLYSLGFLGQIMCGSGGCERVQLSPWAKQFGIPVPAFGLAGYGAMLITAMIGLQPAFARSRTVAAILVAGALISLVYTAWLTYLEAFVINAWCRWCIGSALLVCLMFLAVIPEFWRMRRASVSSSWAGPPS